MYLSVGLNHGGGRLPSFMVWPPSSPGTNITDGRGWEKEPVGNSRIPLDQDASA